MATNLRIRGFFLSICQISFQVNRTSFILSLFIAPKLFDLKQVLAVIAVLLVAQLSYAQKKNASCQLHIHKTNAPIQIDGIIDEQAWTQAEKADRFFMVLPMDTSMAKVPTDVRMCYDDQNMYIMAICYKTIAGVNMVESLRRDFNFVKNDNFIFFIDPFEDQTNGFTFGANAAGAQWDGALYEGGKADLNWDNKWSSSVKDYADRWVFEAAIPFKTIRYKKGIKEWGINFSRNDLKTTEKSSWAPVARQFPTASLAYTGILVWDEPPPAQGPNVSVIPYLLNGISKDYTSTKNTQYKTDIGLDAKISVTSSMNLDLTLHPDFSQVEVDKQVTNLDRFELFFPEKRQFFLENNDLFGNFGNANIRPFFSRRIGLGVPISFGARLSGKLDKNWRLGAMDIQTERVDETGLPAQNFAVLSLQRKVFKRSGIGLMYIDKTSLNYQPGSDPTKPVYSLHNRNLGLEYNLASSNNVWTGKTFFVKSFSGGKPGNDVAHAATLSYNSRKWNIIWQHEYVGKNYSAEVGYVPRQGYIKLNPQVSRLFFPKEGNILSHGPQISATAFFDEKMRKTDDQYNFSYLLTFRNRITLTGLVQYDYVELLQPFDPTNTGKDSLAAGTKHSANTIGFDLISQPQKLFTYAASVRYGGYYSDGKRLSLVYDLGYRFQPYISLALSTTYNHLSLPKPWGNVSFFLIGPKIDVTMTNKLFITGYLQYNDQQKNVNFNARLQWRYKPASDLFIVYTDNYYPSPFSVKNRALVLKFNYWWSL